MGIPEPFKIGTFPFFHREPDHQPQAGHHNPAGKPKCQVAVRSARICPCVLALDVPWACPKVGDEETFDSAIYAEEKSTQVFNHKDSEILTFHELLSICKS